MSPLATGDGTIYLDHAATTPVDPAVLAAMLPYFSDRFGNPSSIYQLGQEAHAALDQARLAVAGVLGCQSSEVLFTSGATESNNLAVRGVAWQARLAAAADAPAPHLVTSQIEHHAVLATVEALETLGFTASYVAPDGDGVVDPEAIAAAMRPETCLVSVMYANNETGAIQPVAEIGRRVRERGVLLHVDAVQAAGLLPLGVDGIGADLLSLSAHKFYGPKGVGVLYVRRGTRIAWQQAGGGQEQGRRGGTENVPGIVGLSVALEMAERMRPAYVDRCAELRDRLWAGIQEHVPDVRLNGPAIGPFRLANNLNFEVPAVQGETLLLGLDMDGVAASAGSACTTGNAEPSHVLRSMGIGDARCRSSLRLTVGRDNTDDEMDEAAELLGEAVRRTRMLAGVGG